MNVQEYIASGILEAVVLGHASDQEQREVQCMSSIYPEIQEALTELQLGVESLAQLHETTPPPKLKTDILAAIENVEQESTETPAQTTNTGRVVSLPAAKAKPNNTGWWVAAAIAALLIPLGLMVVNLGTGASMDRQAIAERDQDILELQQQVEEVKATAKESLAEADQLEAQLAILRHPATQKVTLAGTDNLPEGQALVFWNTETEKAYLDASGLPAPAAGKQYQLWAIVDGQPTDMGVFDLEAATQAVKEMVSVAAPQAFAITLEEEGGKPRPNLAALVVIGNV